MEYGVKPMKKKGRAGKFDESLGKLLRGIRESIGLTREDVANHLEITFQQVQKYEVGVNRVPLLSFLKICDLFKISPNFFLKPLGYTVSIDDIEGFSEAEQESFLYSNENIVSAEEVVNFLQKCSDVNDPELRKKILELIEGY